MSKRFYPGVCQIVLILLLIGCRSPEEALQERYEAVSELYSKAAAQPERTVHLSWDEAKERMMRGNLGLVEADNNVLQARERTQRVFLDLVPSLSVTANLARQFTDLGNLNEEDFRFGIFSSFSVPGIVQLRLNHYAALLQEVRAAWAWELARRERLGQLRILFVRQKNLDRRRKTLRITALTEGGEAAVSGQLGEAPAELERKSREWALTRAYDGLQLDISRLLGDFSAEWVLEPEMLPDLYAGGDLPEAGELEDLAVLWRQLKAVEIEGAHLRELGAELNDWPDLSFRLSSPPLFQRSNGRSEGWDPDAITATLRSNLQIDTSLRNAFRLRQLRRDNALLLARLREDVAELTQRLEDGRVAYQLNRDEAVVVRTRYNLLLRSLGQGSLANANDRLESILTLESQLARIEADQEELRTLFWVLDESSWERRTFDALLRDAKKREMRHAFD